MTYDNRPPLGTILGTVTVSGTTYVSYEVDVTSYIQSQIAGGANLVALAFHNTTDSGTYENVYAKEFSAADATKLWWSEIEIKRRVSQTITFCTF